MCVYICVHMCLCILPHTYTVPETHKHTHTNREACLALSLLDRNDGDKPQTGNSDVAHRILSIQAS